LPAGHRVANYQIEQLIGRGGMAVVYRATDVRLDRVVALKILSPDLARNDAFRQRFIRESRAGAAVDHPHVIPVFEAGDADGVLFIAMRYVAGNDVRALIEREGQLSAQRTVEIVTQVASALDAAHAHGLVHRDVKPANMLIAASESSRADGIGDYVYLSDFGLSKQSLSSSSLTSTGQFLGTLDYMSPEQISGRAVDGRTDLYALGCAAFEMLAGQPPFRREANLAVMWAQISAEPPSLGNWRPDLTVAVDEVIGQALAKVPEDRQASCTDFALALRAACAAGSAATPPVRELTEPAAAVPEDPTVTKRAPEGFAPAAGLAAAGLAPAAAGLANTGPGGAGGPGPAGFGYAGGQPGPAVGPTTPGYAGFAPAGTFPPGGPQLGGSPPAGYSFPQFQPQPPPRRGRVLPVIVACLVVAALAAAAVLVLHLRNSGNPTPNANGTHTVTVHPSSSTPPSSASSTPNTTPTSPQTLTGTTSARSVITGYYQAVNNHDYARAWQINSAAHSISDYPHFVQGFSSTQQVTVTITNVIGDVVYVRIASLHKDGTTHYFSGSYTVQNGMIVVANIS